MRDAAAQFVKSGLRNLGLKIRVRTQLKQQCGITLSCSLRFSRDLGEGCPGMFWRHFFVGYLYVT